MKANYSRGYYQAMDDVMNWINSQPETNIKKFRSLLYGFCLEARPRER